MDHSKLIGACLAVLVIGLATGCGSASDSGNVQPTTGTETTRHMEAPPTPRITQPGKANGRLDDVERRIQAAGHGAVPQPGEGSVVASLRISMKTGGSTFVSGYRSSSDLALMLRRMERVKRSSPSKVAIQTVGTHLYWTASERPLTDAQRAEFMQIVADGAGR